MDNNDKALLSDRIKAFQDALEILYIKANTSGRLKFAAEWPDPARYIFTEELLHADREGLKDKKKREALEGAAEDRRVALLETIATLEAKSADRGVLQVEYVREIITRHGRATALLMYAGPIVDKFVPETAQAPEAPILPPAQETPYVAPEPAIETEAEARKEESPPEEEFKAPAPEPMDEVKPISVEPEKSKTLKIFGIKDSGSDKA
jgi:hypothetical protein